MFVKDRHVLLDKQLEQLNKLLELAPKVKIKHKNNLMATINRLKINVENIQYDIALKRKKPINNPNAKPKIINNPPSKPST